MTMPKADIDSEMDANQRRQAVASILARGVLRYHRRNRRLNQAPAKIPRILRQGALRFSEKRGSVCLSVPGVNATENQKGVA